MVPAGQDQSGPDQSGLDTWLTGVVAICAATLLFSGVLLTGIGAAAHATNPPSAAPSVVETDRRPSPSTEPDPDTTPDRTNNATTRVRPAQPPADAGDPTTAHQRRGPTAWSQAPPRAPVSSPPTEPRGPDPGSSPQFALPITVPTDSPEPEDANLDAAAAQDDVGSLDHPNHQALGEQLLVGGLVALLFSIGGLVTVALRRRAW